ncbi:metallophosphoesterase [Hyphomicrobium sp.]|uniref:metallophosphoesterase n=1 Tax=Hyphomicrobium sp. TaxID=82 RepID=UPI0025C53158|nr:metallophosphoesterase [Hyphomicrobium sp.]
MSEMDSDHSALARCDLRGNSGPFDIIGDVHGCAAELEALLARLGYDVRWSGAPGTARVDVIPPAGRRAVFVGDLVDRGPRSPDVLRIVMGMMESGAALAVPGNHDVKFQRWLDGKDVKPSHGLDRTIVQFGPEPKAFRAAVRAFFNSLPIYLWLDGGALAVAHAGIKEEMLGRFSGEVRRFCLYGETSGETDKFGLPIRYHWAAEYRGSTSIVYGHTPVPDADWVNRTICLDTGCCFGGKLTALRWPERDVVTVPAADIYTMPVRPFGHPPPRPGAML